MSRASIFELGAVRFGGHAVPFWELVGHNQPLNSGLTKQQPKALYKHCTACLSEISRRCQAIVDAYSTRRQTQPCIEPHTEQQSKSSNQEFLRLKESYIFSDNFRCLGHQFWTLWGSYGSFLGDALGVMRFLFGELVGHLGTKIAQERKKEARDRKLVIFWCTFGGHVGVMLTVFDKKKCNKFKHKFEPPSRTVLGAIFDPTWAPKMYKNICSSAKAQRLRSAVNNTSGSTLGGCKTRPKSSRR